MEISNTELIIRMISKNRDISYLPLFAVRTDACSARCSGTMKRQKTDQAISMDMASASGETMKLANAVNYHTQWVQGCGQYYRCVPFCLWTGYVLPVCDRTQAFLFRRTPIHQVQRQ